MGIRKVIIQVCCGVLSKSVKTSLPVYECQTDLYSLSQAVYLSIRFRAEGLVCVITSRKSPVVTISSSMAGMSVSAVEEHHREAAVNMADVADVGVGALMGMFLVARCLTVFM